MQSYLRPIELQAFGLVEGYPSRLRFFYTVTGTSDGPNFRVETVTVEAHEHDLICTISERVTRDSERLMAVSRCLEAELDVACLDRRLIDGLTGRSVPQVTAGAERGETELGFFGRLPGDRCERWPARVPVTGT